MSTKNLASEYKVEGSTPSLSTNNKKQETMSGEIEVNVCDFCKKEKPVTRTYLYPSKYDKPENSEELNKLHNQGDYFTFLSTCNDCGNPTTEKAKHKERKIVLEKDGKPIVLTHHEVIHIVNEWYTNGMEPEVFQNGIGHDLEEHLGCEYGDITISTIIE